MTLQQIEDDDKNLEVKNLLIATQFLHHFTQHSNPILVNKIMEDDKLREKNATLD